jgi:hypothetical protein
VREAFKALAGVCLATFCVYVAFYWDRAKRRAGRLKGKD